MGGACLEPAVLATRVAIPRHRTGERLMGYLYRPKLKSGARSEIWWVKYYVNGRPVRESTGVAAETETPPQGARQFLKEREGRAATGQPIFPRADRIRYEEVAA